MSSTLWKCAGLAACSIRPKLKLDNSSATSRASRVKSGCYDRFSAGVPALLGNYAERSGVRLTSLEKPGSFVRMLARQKESPAQAKLGRGASNQLEAKSQ